LYGRGVPVAAAFVRCFAWRWEFEISFTGAPLIVGLMFSVFKPVRLRHMNTNQNNSLRKIRSHKWTCCAGILFRPPRFVRDDAAAFIMLYCSTGSRAEGPETGFPTQLS
jgi:hypothetical protein